MNTLQRALAEYLRTNHFPAKAEEQGVDHQATQATETPLSIVQRLTQAVERGKDRRASLTPSSPVR